MNTGRKSEWVIGKTKSRVLSRPPLDSLIYCSDGSGHSYAIEIRCTYIYICMGLYMERKWSECRCESPCRQIDGYLLPFFPTWHSPSITKRRSRKINKKELLVRDGSVFPSPNHRSAFAVPTHTYCTNQPQQEMGQKNKINPKYNIGTIYLQYKVRVTSTTFHVSGTGRDPPFLP